MNTKILTSSIDDLVIAGKIFIDGGLVAFPTETVYGLGANALDENAVSKIYKAKGRPSDNPLIVHVAEFEQIAPLVIEIPENAKILMEKFWPGPLTIIMKKSEIVPDIVSGGLNTVAIRMPSNVIAHNMLKVCGLPIAAPSANTSGRPSPTDASYVMDDMMGKIEGIIDGGSCDVGLESTIVDVTGSVPKLLRPGGVTYEELTDALGTVEKKFECADGEKPLCPGMKYKHYSPVAPVYIVRGDFETKVNELIKKYENPGIITKNNYNFVGKFTEKNVGIDSKKYAEHLFAYLRDFDKMNADVIFAEDVSDKGIDLAVRNRLYKAAGYKIIE